MLCEISVPDAVPCWCKTPPAVGTDPALLSLPGPDLPLSPPKHICFLPTPESAQLNACTRLTDNLGFTPPCFQLTSPCKQSFALSSLVTSDLPASWPQLPPLSSCLDLPVKLTSKPGFGGMPQRQTLIGYDGAQSSGTLHVTVRHHHKCPLACYRTKLAFRPMQLWLHSISVLHMCSAITWLQYGGDKGTVYNIHHRHYFHCPVNATVHRSFFFFFFFFNKTAHIRKCHCNCIKCLLCIKLQLTFSACKVSSSSLILWFCCSASTLCSEPVLLARSCCSRSKCLVSSSSLVLDSSCPLRSDTFFFRSELSVVSRVWVSSRSWIYSRSGHDW